MSEWVAETAVSHIMPVSLSNGNASREVYPENPDPEYSGRDDSGRPALPCETK